LKKLDSEKPDFRRILVLKAKNTIKKLKPEIYVIYFQKFIVACTHNFFKNKMNKGTVKFFNDTKGFGFIKDAESTKEYFVHVSGCKDEIQENDEVTFDLEEGKKGLNAVNVKLV
jgi:CspA family cold shock protein